MVSILRRAAAILVFGWCGVASAVPVAIVNPSFELPDLDPACSGAPSLGNCVAPNATGWTISGSGGGVWDINDFPSGFWTVGAPDGDQIGWLAPAGPNTLGAEFSQILSAVLQPNTLYALTGFAGHPTGFPTTYSVELYAGGNLLDTLSDTGPQGNFESFLLDFDSAGSPFVGLPLEIRLRSAAPQTGFDLIALDATARQGNGVSEPATLLLVGVGLLGAAFSARRRFRLRG